MAEPCKCKLIPDLRRAYGINARTDDPTRASFVFAHSLALSDTSHEVQIFLTADATCLTRKATSDAVMYDPRFRHPVRILSSRNRFRAPKECEPRTLADQKQSPNSWLTG